MKKVIILLIIASIGGVAFWQITNNDKTTKGLYKVIDEPLFNVYDGMTSEGRESWQLNRLKDPSTGEIPSGMRARELSFARKLPSAGIFGKSINWNNRGPYNVGGRSRAVAIDHTDHGHILAGSVSGGVWNSNDGGQTWTKVTTPEQSYGVVSIVQDKRPGKSNIWYYTTGEGVGTSASGGGAFYLGNGVYKSVDNGQSWNLLNSTHSGTPHQFDEYWDVTWNIALDAGDTVDDVVYVATLGRIYKSEDGGSSWDISLSGSTYSYFTDVAVSDSGVVYATMSSDGSSAGIWRSEDGDNWTNITPSNWPQEYERIVIGMATSDQNILYLLAHTPGYGQMTNVFFGKTEWNSLWKYRYKSGNGSGTGGVWENRSASLPHQGNPFDVFNAQGSYNLLVKVHPQDTNIVIIGGTNLYRSTDAFRSDSNTTHIGGYAQGTTLPEYDVYPNQHPDQHGIAFMPGMADTLIAATDGGLWQTNDILKDSVDWIDLNNGYLTTQFYTINFDPVNGGSSILFGGLQDNGSFYVNSDNSQAGWVQPSLGDGAFCAMNPGTDVFYFSRQRGKTGKMRLDTNSGQVMEFQRIDPAGLKDPLFINPFVLDQNDADIMYMAGGKTVWRNHDLSQIPYNNNYDSISLNWNKLFDSLPVTGRTVTALATSKQPANRLYIGTSGKYVYRIDNAHQGMNKTLTDIAPVFFPINGNVSCIAVDPRDADKVIVVFSNYIVQSLFYSDDGGSSWKWIGGNLEGSNNSGPSVRWADIMPLDNGKTIYWLATSTGVYATDTLIDHGTVWTHQSPDKIGFTVTDVIRSRPSDGLVVAATHGEGVFSAYVNSVDQIQKVEDQKPPIVNIYPNPFKDQLNIDLSGIQFNKKLQVRIYGLKGRLLFEQKVSQPQINIQTGAKNLSSGVYLLEISNGNKRVIKKIIKE
ncbi:MAG: T9SS type A sorting domain-containing protein [Bacteroidales bacterium]|nr:T9SS type A sorting domain-containing protein [Bacteroidales bacterium]